MNPAVVQILILAIQLATKFVENYPQIREAMTTDDRDKLDAAYSDFRAQSNAVADRLRATPDDPVA